DHDRQLLHPFRLLSRAAALPEPIAIEHGCLVPGQPRLRRVEKQAGYRLAMASVKPAIQGWLDFFAGRSPCRTVLPAPQAWHRKSIRLRRLVVTPGGNGKTL